MNAVEHLKAVNSLSDKCDRHNTVVRAILDHCRAALSLLEPAPLDWALTDSVCQWRSDNWLVTCRSDTGLFRVNTENGGFDTLAAAKAHCQSLANAARDPLATVRRKVEELLAATARQRENFTHSTNSWFKRDHEHSGIRAALAIINEVNQ